MVTPVPQEADTFANTAIPVPQEADTFANAIIWY